MPTTRKQIIPEIGKFYSPYPDYPSISHKLIKEDEMFYFFHDRVKFNKALDFSWYEVVPPVEVLNEAPFVWPYESYSLWSRQLAETYTKAELQKIVTLTESLSDKYAKQHLSAIEATTSMQSQSQRRAHARNNVSANYEKKRAHMDALEIHEQYSGKCNNN